MAVVRDGASCQGFGSVVDGAEGRNEDVSILDADATLSNTHSKRFGYRGEEICLSHFL